MLSVAPGLSHEVISLNGPTDSISVELGNGYNICGELEYTLSGADILPDRYLTFSPTLNSGAVDTLAFGLHSEATGSFIPYRMALIVSLKDYPTATSAIIPVIFNYRECSPFDFRFQLKS